MVGYLLNHARLLASSAVLLHMKFIDLRLLIAFEAESAFPDYAGAWSCHKFCFHVCNISTFPVYASPSNPLCSLLHTSTHRHAFIQRHTFTSTHKCTHIHNTNTRTHTHTHTCTHRKWCLMTAAPWYKPSAQGHHQDRHLINHRLAKKDSREEGLCLGCKQTSTHFLEDLDLSRANFRV